ncbi:MAG TPA: methyltransferase domain-containing protein [Allosphingosinicella sp.]|nr:methyltransferase domain-containing protein [Allosphingosinicella sp.]
MPSRSFLRAMLVGAGVVLAALLVFAAWRHFTAEPEAGAPADFDPSAFVHRPKLDAPYVVTDYQVVDAMLAMAQVRPEDHVIDLGSGDGRILIAAARSHGARGLGVEIDPARIREAEQNARAAGVAHRVEFRRQDLFETPLAEADLVTLYLTPEVNLRLRPRILAQMRPGTRVVSHDFDMGEWRPDARQRIGSATILMWIVPARVAGRWTLDIGGRRAELELQQRFQQLSGTLAGGGRSARIEQGVVAGARIRFVAETAGGRRVFEGRVEGDRIVPLQADAGWRAARAG